MKRLPLRDIEIIAPNFKKRLSGVTSTIMRLVPLQRAQGTRIAAISPKGGLPSSVAQTGFSALLCLWKAPQNRSFRIWHARRNIEMLAGVFMRDILRMKLRLIFTSAAQRDHKFFTKALIRRMDKVIAVNARSASYLQVPHCIIRHGVDTEIFTPPQTEEDKFSASGLKGDYAIGCFGRIRHQKGTDLFVNAMLDLLPRYPQWTAIITGRVTAEHKAFAESLKAKIAAANMQERIIFLGEVADISRWYKRLTLYVAPSRNEGFGLTPLEAFASQTAVVAADAGAYAELVTEDTGKIVPAGDLPALKAAIEPYLADPQTAIAAGNAALSHVREYFPLAKEADAINSVYEDIFQTQKR